MKRNFRLPPPVKAPQGPPPELPSERRNKAVSATLEAQGGVTPAQPAKSPLEQLLEGRNPDYPFIPPHRLADFAEGELEDRNRIYKIMLFYEHEKEYRMLVAHFGERHRFYRDKFNYGYGDQEENKNPKGKGGKSANTRLAGRNFYNS